MSSRPNRKSYNINAEWDDPFEKKKDKRDYPRTESSLRVKIGVQKPDQSRPLVGTGLLLDISASGLNCRTKQRVKPGQHIKVSIPTDNLPESMSLPDRFNGDAEVIRVNKEDEAISKVAIKFSNEITTDLNFVMFIDQLHTLSRT